MIPRFNMRRVVSDYAAGIYRPAAAQYATLAADGGAPVRGLAEWQLRVRKAWSGVALRRLHDAPREIARGKRLRIRVAVALNGLTPADVAVEFVAQRMLPRPDCESPLLASFRPCGDQGRWTEILAPTGETGQRRLARVRARRRAAGFGAVLGRDPHPPAARAADASAAAGVAEAAVGARRQRISRSTGPKLLLAGLDSRRNIAKLAILCGGP